MSEIREEYGETSYHVYSDTALDATEPTADGRHRAVVDTMAEVEAIQDAAKAAGGSVTDIRTNEASLESIFLELTGKQMASPRTAADTDPTNESDEEPNEEPAADRPEAEDAP